VHQEPVLRLVAGVDQTGLIDRERVVGGKHDAGRGNGNTGDESGGQASIEVHRDGPLAKNLCAYYLSARRRCHDLTCQILDVSVRNHEGRFATSTKTTKNSS